MVKVDKVVFSLHVIPIALHHWAPHAFAVAGQVTDEGRGRGVGEEMGEELQRAYFKLDFFDINPLSMLTVRLLCTIKL